MADQPAKKRRRIVKNPETFRERALKASAEADQPAKSGLVRGAAGRVFSPVFRPVGRGLGRLARFRVVRLVGKIVLPVYLRNSWQELKLVSWPNWRESRRLTSAVLIFAIIFGASIALVDYGLDKLFRTVLLK